MISGKSASAPDAAGLRVAEASRAAEKTKTDFFINPPSHDCPVQSMGSVSKLRISRISRRLKPKTVCFKSDDCPNSTRPYANPGKLSQNFQFHATPTKPSPHRKVNSSYTTATNHSPSISLRGFWAIKSSCKWGIPFDKKKIRQ